jgi:F-type H+-transporting ATPase subunit delta
MSNYAVANRYSVALFQLGKEQGSLTQFANELQLVKEVFILTPELSSVLLHPKVSQADKVSIIKDNFASYLSDSVINTLLIVIERGRGDILLSIIDKFKQLAYDEQGKAEAKVYSVKPLSDEDKEVISKQFAKKVGKETLMIENIVDGELIGGLKIRIGDRIYDGSVKGQLDRMRFQLVGTNR